MGNITAVEIGADTCALASTSVQKAELRVNAAETLDPAAFPGIDAFTLTLRQTRKSLKLPRACRAVVWGLPDGATRRDPVVAPLIEPLTRAGFRVRRVVTPCNALGALSRLRTSRTGGAMCWLGINRNGVAIVVIRPGKLLYSHSFAWDSSVGASGSQARLLQRYSLVAFLAPEVRRALAAAKQKGTTVDGIVTCGNLPDLRALTMPLIEELDIEVETLDSLEGLVMEPALADKLLEVASAIRLACAGAFARETRAVDESKRRRVRRTSRAVPLLAAAALLALAAGGYWWYTSWTSVRIRAGRPGSAAPAPNAPAGGPTSTPTAAPTSPNAPLGRSTPATSAAPPLPNVPADRPVGTALPATPAATNPPASAVSPPATKPAPSPSAPPPAAPNAATPAAPATTPPATVARNPAPPVTPAPVTKPAPGSSSAPTSPGATAPTSAQSSANTSAGKPSSAAPPATAATKNPPPLPATNPPPVPAKSPPPMPASSATKLAPGATAVTAPTKNPTVPTTSGPPSSSSGQGSPNASAGRSNASAGQANAPVAKANAPAGKPNVLTTKPATPAGNTPPPPASKAARPPVTKQAPKPDKETPPALNPAPRPTDKPEAASGARPTEKPLPEPLKDSVPKVTAILVAADRRLATVGDEGQIIAVGDTIGRRVVVSIDDRTVVLREPSGLLIRVALGGRVVGMEMSDRY